MSSYMLGDWSQLPWSRWMPMDADNATYRDQISDGPGFYRVRSEGAPTLAYIGQTGRDLRERVRGLRNQVCRRELPPWGDPHTAAPGLWAWRLDDGYVYEVSAAEWEGSYPDRQCFEDMLLADHRLEAGESTLCNHGRFHPGWRRPSIKRDQRAMVRTPKDEPNPASGRSLQAPGGGGDPSSADWLGLAWSRFVDVGDAAEGAPTAAGVYRLRSGNSLVYIGESKNLRKRFDTYKTDPDKGQAKASWSLLKDPVDYHLKELETDLIGAYFRKMRKSPLLQYRRTSR